ncbi:MAG TPA: hypothetical protein VGP47_05495 [Parachlamydiaceae bacterium]|nr:hypothetical protein [Parachlamydiaceae bacterium]
MGVENCQLRISDYSFKSPQAGSYIIQIPMQYLNLIKLNCILILRNKNIFKAFGNSEAETLNKESFLFKDYTLSLNDFLTINNLTDTICKFQPLDNKRQNIAEFIGMLINSFILYHELGHVRQLNFISNSEVLEVEFKELRDNRKKWREQAAEVDADIFAIHFIWGDVFSNLRNFNSNAIYDSREELLILALYSVFLFFYLSNTSNNIRDRTSEHPHPIVRFSIVSNFLQELTLKNSIVDSNIAFNKIVQIALRELDSTLKYHFNISESKLYYKKFIDPSITIEKSIMQHFIARDETLNFNRPYVFQ